MKKYKLSTRISAYIAVILSLAMSGHLMKRQNLNGYHLRFKALIRKGQKCGSKLKLIL